MVEMFAGSLIGSPFSSRAVTDADLNLPKQSITLNFTPTDRNKIKHFFETLKKVTEWVENQACKIRR